MSKKRLTKDEVLSFPIEKIERATEKELREYTRVLNDVANKRLKRLEETGYYKVSPAYVAVDKGGRRGQGKFSLKDAKTRNQVLAEFTRVKGFITSSTSTISGSKKLQQDLSKRLQKNLTFDEQIKMWRINNELKKRQLAIYMTLKSQRMQTFTAEKLEQYPDIETAVNELEKEMIQIYESEQSMEKFLEITSKNKLPF